MSVESYIAHMAQAGISRGQLETHFYDRLSATVQANMAPFFLDGDAPTTPYKPPPLEQDLSYLNSPHWKKNQAGGAKPKPANRRRARLKRNLCVALVKWVKQVWEPAA